MQGTRTQIKLSVCQFGFVGMLEAQAELYGPAGQNTKRYLCHTHTRMHTHTQLSRSSEESRKARLKHTGHDRAEKMDRTKGQNHFLSVMVLI